MSYLDLITSEHADKPNFTVMVGASLQPTVDISNQLSLFPALFDIDLAVGQQLDVIGQWVGVTRNLAIQLVGVYSAFDTAGVGFDQGVWLGPYDSVSGLTVLPDEYYRLLIKMDILNNHWDGTKDQAYIIAQTIYGSLGYKLYIEDNCDLTINLGLVGTAPPTLLVQSLLTSGIMEIKPAGIHINAYYTQSSLGLIAGFDLPATPVVFTNLIGGAIPWLNSSGVPVDLNTSHIYPDSIFGGFDNSSWANVTLN